MIDDLLVPVKLMSKEDLQKLYPEAWTEEDIAAVDQGVADKIKFLDEMRAMFLSQIPYKWRMAEWLRHHNPDIEMLPFHQDNNTGECTWLNRKARRG